MAKINVVCSKFFKIIKKIGFYLIKRLILIKIVSFSIIEKLSILFIFLGLNLNTPSENGYTKQILHLKASPSNVWVQTLGSTALFQTEELEAQLAVFY